MLLQGLQDPSLCPFPLPATELGSQHVLRQLVHQVVGRRAKLHDLFREFEKLRFIDAFGEECVDAFGEAFPIGIHWFSPLENGGAGVPQPLSPFMKATLQGPCRDAQKTRSVGHGVSFEVVQRNRLAKLPRQSVDSLANEQSQFTPFEPARRRRLLRNSGQILPVGMSRTLTSSRPHDDGTQPRPQPFRVLQHPKTRQRRLKPLGRSIFSGGEIGRHAIRRRPCGPPVPPVQIGDRIGSSPLCVFDQLLVSRFAPFLRARDGSTPALQRKRSACPTPQVQE